MSTREGGGLRDKRADAALVLSEISILRPQTLQEPLNQPDWEHCRQIARKSSRFVDFCSYTSSGGLLVVADFATLWRTTSFQGSADNLHEYVAK